MTRKVYTRMSIKERFAVRKGMQALLDPRNFSDYDEIWNRLMRLFEPYCNENLDPRDKIFANLDDAKESFRTGMAKMVDDLRTQDY